jgi:hypothetical protein
LKQAVDEDGGSSEESEEESSSSDDEPEVEQKPKKGRILKAFEDSDDEASQKDSKISLEDSEKDLGPLHEATEIPEQAKASEAASDALFTTQDVVKIFGAAQDDLFDSPVTSDARTFEDIFSTQPCK